MAVWNMVSFTTGRVFWAVTGGLERAKVGTENNGSRLDGRVGIITGASSGIGRAVARALAAEGAAVVLAARRLERLEADAAELRAAGGQALAVATDVTRLDDVRALVKAAQTTFGRVDILVNNAGIMPLSPLAEGRVEDWTRMVDVNVNGVLHGIAAVLPVMLEQGTGHIINVGSVAGRRPFPGGTVYSATKFAVRALSWGLHLELGAEHGIRATDIQPGYVETELINTMPDPDARQAWTERWADKRALQADDVARAVLYAATAPPHVAVSEVLVRPLDQPT